MTDFLALLEYSYATECDYKDTAPSSRLDFLAESVFNFTTYEQEISEFLAAKAVAVCEAISDRKTFDFIADHDRRIWYLTMVNMPFFADRLEWGTSIRGAWWKNAPNHLHILESCGLWKDGEQVLRLELTPNEWHEFIAAVIAFAREPCAESEQGSLTGD